jgi:hypothetical protein
MFIKGVMNVTEENQLIDNQWSLIGDMEMTQPERSFYRI